MKMHFNKIKKKTKNDFICFKPQCLQRLKAFVVTANRGWVPPKKNLLAAIAFDISKKKKKTRETRKGNKILSVGKNVFKLGTLSNNK